MTERVTYEQAAEILGCHISNVSKLVEKGHLVSSGRRGAALDLRQVEQLAQRREVERERRQTKAPRDRRINRRPDLEHEWLSPREVAVLLGVTPQAVTKRIRRERLPAVESGGRHWVRRDLLEQAEAARLARRTRQP